MNSNHAAAVSRLPPGRVGDLRAGQVSRPVAPIRVLLRLPLYYKLIIANGVIALTAVLTCAAFVAAAVRSNPTASTSRLIWSIVIAAAVIGGIVNSIVVRLALTPVRNLVDVAEEVGQGNVRARAPDSVVSDAALEDVSTVFNTMLDSMASYRTRLREIAIRAVDAGEAERARLSRELHDGVAQSLAAVLMQLRVARNSGAGALDAQLADSADQLAAAINQLRALAQELRPPALDMIGITAAIRGYSRNISETTGVRIIVRTSGIDRVLPNEADVALYRVVQEALTNVVRHAQTDEAVVDVQILDDALIATVADDGAGFNVPKAMAGGALGLFGMHERAQYAGGNVTIRSSPGHGTVVHITIPITDRING